MAARIYKWVTGLREYQKLNRELEKKGLFHYIDYTKKELALAKAATLKGGIVIGRRYKTYSSLPPNFAVFYKKKVPKSLIRS